MAEALSPSQSAMKLTKAVAAYVKDTFLQILLSGTTTSQGSEKSTPFTRGSRSVIPSVILPIPLVVECDQLAEVLAAAYRNPSKI